MTGLKARKREEIGSWVSSGQGSLGNEDEDFSAIDGHHSFDSVLRSV
jgi:hypothetical protein